jgi:hypothetical protein
MTRRIGRRRSDASPVTKAVNGWVARMPSSSRAEVPELPRSMTSPGSARPPSPTPSTRHCPSASRTISAPIARNAAAVASTSSPSNRPRISVRPIARAPNISARCEIDLSPGTDIVPDNGAAGRDATSGIAERKAASSGIRIASIIETLAGGAGSAHMPQPNAMPCVLCF